MSPSYPEVRRPEVGPLLATLSDGGVRFVVVGAHAARAHGVVLDPSSHSEALQITPSPAPVNLRLLSRALARTGSVHLAGTGAEGSPPVRLSGQLFPWIPVLPLITTLGPLTVVQHATGAPEHYPALEHLSVQANLDGVDVMVPAIRGLLRGVAGGWRTPSRALLEQLRHRLVATAALNRSEGPVGAEPQGEGQLTEVILRELAELGRPVTVRELLLMIRLPYAPTYREMRIAADRLTTAGLIAREKSGAAYRYRSCADTRVDSALSIVRILQGNPDPDAVVRRALDLLAAGAPN